MVTAYQKFYEVIHVEAIRKTYQIYIKKFMDYANESIKKDMEKKMEKIKEKCDENNLESEVIVKIGNAAEIILDMIKEKKIDLIVMAKRRKLKGIKGLLTLGSVSRKIIENTSCPVFMMDAEKK